MGMQGDDETRLANDNHNLGRKDFGFDVVDVTFGVEARGNISELAQDVIDLVDAIDGINSGDDLTVDQVEDSINVITRLVQLDNPENVIFFDGNAGTSLRFGRLAIGARGFGQAMAFLNELDSTNLGFDTGSIGNDLSSELDEYLTDSGYTGGTNIGVDYDTIFLSDEQVTALTGAGFNNDAIVAIDQLLNNPDISNDFSQQEISDFVDLAVDVQTAAAGSGNLEDNNTSVSVVGFAGAEIPVSYGYPITQELSVGATGKLMFAEVGAKVFRVFDDAIEDEIDTVLDETESSSTIGLDLGAMYRLPNFQFGIAGKNLNAPEFDGPEITYNRIVGGLPVATTEKINSVTLEPQITIGAA